MNVVYKEATKLNKAEILKLYSDVGWTAYTNDPDTLMAGIEASLNVITAWDNNKLIGLIRVVGDGKTIIYIQDILVLKEYQRTGIGTTLLNMIFDRYKDVRQMILLTDSEAQTINFYTKNGMTNVKEWNATAFGK